MSKPASVVAPTGPVASGGAAQVATEPDRATRTQRLEEQHGDGPNVLTLRVLSTAGVQGALRSPKAAQNGPPLFVEEHVRRVDRSVAQAQVVKVGDDGGQGGAEACDHGGRLLAQGTHVAAPDHSQHQPIRRIAPLHIEKLDDAWMSNSPQHGRLLAKPAAFFGGVSSLVGQTARRLADNIHQH